MAKINILQLVNSLDIGGLEKVVLEIVQYDMTGTSTFDYHVACLNQIGMLADQIHENLPILILNKNENKYYTIVKRLAHYCKNHKIQVIHCHNYAPLLFSVLTKLYLLNRIKVVYTEHNQIYSISKRHFRIFKQLVKGIDHLVYVSNDLRQYFLTNVFGNKSKIVNSVVWNGIKKPVYTKKDIIEIKKKNRIFKGQFVVGTAVVMSKQKALHNLIKCSVGVINQYPDIVFLMVGDGPLRKDLEKMAISLNIKKNFCFVGFQKRVAGFLKAMDIFILPSLWEGFSIVLLEATAIGVPVIATDVGGNKEIVGNGETGILIPPNDVNALTEAIVKLVSDKAVRTDFSKNAMRKFEGNFTVDEMVHQYENIYNSLIST